MLVYTEVVDNNQNKKQKHKQKKATQKKKEKRKKRGAEPPYILDYKNYYFVLWSSVIFLMES